MIVWRKVNGRPSGFYVGETEDGRRYWISRSIVRGRTNKMGPRWVLRDDDQRVLNAECTTLRAAKIDAAGIERARRAEAAS